MSLADFIERNIEPILAEWESFAATLLPAAKMSPLELRDHAGEMLNAIVLDLRAGQTAEAQKAKSQGRAPVPFPARETAAKTHAVLRARSGFDIKQLAAEYRALRASVLRLWLDSEEPGARVLDDVVRFDEAIDQALAESIEHFHAQVEQSRNLLLGILGHDMRSPLQSIQMTATYLGHLNAGDAVSQAAQRLINSGSRLQGLLDDLVDFNRSNLGLGFSLSKNIVSLATVCASELESIRAAHPECPIELAVVGNTEGHWDVRRMQQVISNLVENAISHGTPRAPVQVSLTGSDSDVQVQVTNHGTAIETEALRRMFEPLARGLHPGHPSGLGLGLFIVKQVATAHGGRIDARSEGGGTTFTVLLPKGDVRKLS